MPERLWGSLISQRLCKVFSSTAINPEIMISFVFFQRVLPRFCLKQRKDEKCRARDFLTAENRCLLGTAPSRETPPPPSSHSLHSGTSAEWWRGSSDGGPVQGDAASCLPPSSALMTERVGPVKLKFQKGFF